MDVPELVLINVFNSLPLYDQLAARLVCKQWQRLIEENLAHSARELVIFSNIQPRPLIWHHNDQPVNLSNSLVVNPKIKEARLFKELFLNIRRLYVVYCVCRLDTSRMQREVFDFLNNFSGLEHVEVYDGCSMSLHESCRTNLDFELPNLKTLFSDPKVQTSSLIASPRLEQLAFYDDFHLDFQLAFLKTNLKLLKVFSFSHAEFIELPNLEVLYFHGSLQIELANFKKLREIHFVILPVYHWIEKFNENNPVRLARTAFEELFEQKQRLKRDNPRVYFEGIRCEASSFREITRRKRILRSGCSKCSRAVIRPSDLESFQQNRDDFQVRNLRLYFEYSSQFDDVLAAMSDEQVERLARSLEIVVLVDQLNGGLLQSSRFERLFHYVEDLYVDEERFSQFDVLPVILPNLVSVGIVRPSPSGGYHSEICVLPACITSKFARLKVLALWGKETSPNELKKLLDNCRFFTTLTISTGRYKAEIVRFTSFSKDLAFYKLLPRKNNANGFYYSRCLYDQLVNMSNFSNQQIVEFLDQNNFFDEDSVETAMNSFEFERPAFPDARPGDVIHYRGETIRFG